MRLILFIILFAYFSIGSYGCDCVIMPFEEVYKMKNNIIIARVVSIYDSEIDRTQTGIQDSTIGYKPIIKITEVLKGNYIVNNEIHLTSNLSTCAFVFKEQMEYVLFLDEINGQIYVTICSYSNYAAHMTARIKKMRKWNKK